MTRHFFEEYSDILSDHTIQLGDGHTLKAESKGSVKLLANISKTDCKQLTLVNVPYVPGLSVNLFSVSAA